MRYAFDVTCPRCGGDVKHNASSGITPPLTVAARAVAHCRACSTDWLLVLELAPARREAMPADTRDRPPCGTERGYSAHLRRKETTCQPCRDAHRLFIAGTGRSHHRKKVDA